MKEWRGGEGIFVKDKVTGKKDTKIRDTYDASRGMKDLFVFLPTIPLVSGDGDGTNIISFGGGRRNQETPSNK